jgi:hypothetical protein
MTVLKLLPTPNVSPLVLPPPAEPRSPFPDYDGARVGAENLGRHSFYAFRLDET